MSARKVLPEGMLKAIHKEVDELPQGWCLSRRSIGQLAAHVVLLYLSENPIVPNESLRHDLWLIANRGSGVNNERLHRLLAEFQRRMFDAPEPEVPTYEELVAAWKKCRETGAVANCIPIEYDSAYSNSVLYPDTSKMPQPRERMKTQLEVELESKAEPEVPEEIKHLQRIHLANVSNQEELDTLVRALNLEAFRRGQQSQQRKD